MAKKVTTNGRAKTSETTKRVLKFLFLAGCYAWRQNVLPVYGADGVPRPGSKAGQPDIVGIYGCKRVHLERELPCVLQGRYLGIEVKTGRDRLRPAQEGFIQTARNLGAIILVVKDYDDFCRQWDELMEKYHSRVIIYGD